MRTLIKFGFLVAMIGSASAQQPPPEPSAYCRSAAQALFLAAGDAELAIVKQKCRRGDTIAIQIASQGAVFQVARLCDFTKAVITMGPQVVCVLVGERGIR